MDCEKSLNHTSWECKYHIVWIPKYRRKVLYEKLRQHLGGVLRELVSTVGKDESTVREYIKRQEQEDKHIEQLKIFV